jgi:hypothetical protein
MTSNNYELFQLYTYNVMDGLWCDLDGIPLVTKIVEGKEKMSFGDTIKTATREQADSPDTSYEMYLSTLITETREGIDQSEGS